eukprot:8128927-Pyramimonas_sp.AAC.1
MQKYILPSQAHSSKRPTANPCLYGNCPWGLQVERTPCEPVLVRATPHQRTSFAAPGGTISHSDADVSFGREAIMKTSHS